MKLTFWMMLMKKAAIFILITSIFIFSASLFAKVLLSNDDIDQKAMTILQRMSLKEKIGQKFMFEVRYWCSTKPMDNQVCSQDFVTMNSDVKNMITQNHIGGIILFSSNLKTIPQITTLTHDFQEAMGETANLPLLIGTDQEGGLVTRLPSYVSVQFPGNMAITAAYLGHPEKSYAYDVAKTIAINLKAVGINVNFAPDIDVNVNPLNPIINVRSFSDDPELVTKLGLQYSQALQTMGIASTLKHFPGHGDTINDSHIGLPVVHHDLEQAWQIDLYPFKKIIEEEAPDMIMTAHIQYPVLDDTSIFAPKSEKNITVPATLSHKIQHDLLRNELHFQGVIITDAMDMGAIIQNFDSIDATIKAFQAGDDIALMPIFVYQPEDLNKVAELISRVESAVQQGDISIQELDQSVLRIIKLKLKLGLFKPDEIALAEKILQAENIFSNKDQHELEKTITNDAITLVKNKERILPIKLQAHTRIYIVMPRLEEGAGIALEMMRLQKEKFLPADLQINFVEMAETHLDVVKQGINNADIVIVGNMTANSTALKNPEKIIETAPVSMTKMFLDRMAEDTAAIHTNKNIFLTEKNTMIESQFALLALQYAKSIGKKTIFISLLTPYDLPNYQDVSDAMLVGYDMYGYVTNETGGYQRGPSMSALARVIVGKSTASGKLPVNVPSPADPTLILYPRGFSVP